MGELRDSELATVMAHWRDYYERADDYEAAERRAWLKWTGIPPEFVKKWDAERKRRSKSAMLGISLVGKRGQNFVR
jgi:hypothetical protein